MKKVLLVLLFLILIVGCEKKKEEAPLNLESVKKISTSNATYYDKNHSNYTGDSLDEMTFYPDGTIFRRMCALRGSCNFYTGEYHIYDDKIEIILDKWLNNKDEWEDLAASRHSEYEITDNNSFIPVPNDSNAEFVIGE